MCHILHAVLYWHEGFWYFTSVGWVATLGYLAISLEIGKQVRKSIWCNYEEFVF